MTVCSQGEIHWLAVEAIGERYRRYRLPDSAAEAAIVRSLARHGQISPIVVSASGKIHRNFLTVSSDCRPRGHCLV